MEVKFQLNGKPAAADIEPDCMLLDLLRDMGCYSVKRGCDTTNCGLCTVLVDGKPSLSCAMPAARADGKEIAVPKVQGLDMIFYKLTDFAQLAPGYYGIPEPVSGEIVQWEDALMIMPGVAFDRQNHRVGYGGGFYDRYLEKHPRVKRVAAAFEFQLLPQVPTEPTDISPEIVVTEKQCIRG